MARQKARSGAARARGRRGGQVAKQRGVGLQRPVKPDDALGEIVGPRAQSRPQLVKGIWSYIKSHDLQDPADGRVIRPDRALRRVLGNKARVSMFEISRYVNEHVRT